MSMPERMMPHQQDGRFWNYPGELPKKLLLPSCLMYLKKLLRARASDKAQLEAWQLFNESLTLDTQLHDSPLLMPSPATSITWIGHASFLLKVGSCSILTDPLFNNLTPLLPRYQAAGIARNAVPAVDVVIISHNHWDHLEKATVIYLAKKYNPVFLVPYGDKKTLIAWGISRVHEHTWWDRYTHTKEHSEQKTTFTFLPAHHWSGRGLFDANRSLWGSWMISSDNYNCYFAGDTAYGAHFQAIAHEFPLINTALMPIGPCEPNKYLSQSHINAEQAGQAFLELNAQHLIPMHWGTFGFGVDSPLAPLYRLEAWWQHAVMNSAKNLNLIPLRVGQQLSVESTTVSSQKIVPASEAFAHL